MSTEAVAASVTTPAELLELIQGHRRLTRRVIELFPDDQLFTFSIGGMRTFGEIATELAFMFGPTLHGIVTGEWIFEPRKFETKAELLQEWDATTERINELWTQLPVSKFRETMTAFGQWTGTGTWLLQYCIDNENHHRGQGYVYLRALGIEPPPFWER